MKYLKYIVLMLVALPMISCSLDDKKTDEWKEWREKNENWLAEQEVSGKYQKVEAVWNPQAYVLMKWHNNRALTKNNLSPLSNSTIDVKYHLRNINNVPIDSSYNRTTPADSIYRTRLNSNIQGWVIALTQMHVGDSCTIVVPYQQGYGTVATGSMAPYSNLIFDVKLVGIPGYNTPVQ